MAGTGAPAPFGLPPLAAPAGDDLLEEGIRKLVFLPGGPFPAAAAPRDTREEIPGFLDP